MPEGRRVYLIEPAGTERADRLAFLEDADVAVVAFETPRAFRDVAAWVHRIGEFRSAEVRSAMMSDVLARLPRAMAA